MENIIKRLTLCTKLSFSVKWVCISNWILSIWQLWLIWFEFFWNHKSKVSFLLFILKCWFWLSGRNCSLIWKRKFTTFYLKIGTKRFKSLLIESTRIYWQLILIWLIHSLSVIIFNWQNLGVKEGRLNLWKYTTIHTSKIKKS